MRSRATRLLRGSTMSRFNTKATLALTLFTGGSGVAYAVLSGGNWFDIDPLYGTNGVSAPAAAVSYSHSLVVDRNDATHGSYSLLSALPNSTSGYQGPYSILRRTGAGAIDTSFGANGRLVKGTTPL